MPNGITHDFVWYNQLDSCPQCSALGGRVWQDQDIYKDRLFDAIWGDIFDLSTGQPLTHGGTGKNCRCKLEIITRINWSEFPEVKVFYVDRDVEDLQEETEIITDATDMSQIQALRENVRGLKEEISGLTMSYHQLREMETMLQRALRLIERSTGNEDIREAINIIQQVTTAARMLQITLIAVNAAAGPIGWASALLSAGMTVSYITTAGYEYTRGTS